MQYDTKQYFMQQFQLMVDRSKDASSSLKLVRGRVESALQMQMMMIEIQSSVNLAQVYQWLQEKSLLSMGALLFNPTPGMAMHACDLARNLFMSPWASESLEDQEHIHARLWLDRIELPCSSSSSNMDRLLHLMLEEEGAHDHPPGETERMLMEVARSPAFGHQDLSGLWL
eukprot:TRINITY_DN6242_c0_g1_i1.p2 TRINITY_DN6242_c0_g1~~TRINITY_DN6242_c0_g1_i1.p2  ORF type:complete len:186 (+),score=42.97 TRINITY_DN6242_c0_g1_i1:48-560(+)